MQLTGTTRYSKGQMINRSASIATSKTLYSKAQGNHPGGHRSYFNLCRRYCKTDQGVPSIANQWISIRYPDGPKGQKDKP